MEDRRAGVDIRLFERPRAYSGLENEFPEFRFKLLSYVDMIDERMVEEMEAAEQHQGPIIAPSEQGMARRGRILYALLVGLLTGRGLKILQGVTHHNGYEAWRQVVAEYAPRIVQRKLGALQRVLAPKVGLETLREDVMTWEAAVREYEELEDRAMGVDMKIGILLKALPGAIQQHLFLNATSYEGDYAAMRRILDMFVISSGRWLKPSAAAGRQDGVVDMEVDAILKGQKGKGKGEEGRIRRWQSWRRKRRRNQRAERCSRPRCRPRRRRTTQRGRSG